MALFKKYRKHIWATVGIVFGMALLALLAWTLYLDRIVTRQFEGRRWTLPAQVYAEPTELYVGQTLSAVSLERELQRLGYHSVAQPRQPGSYSRSGSRVELVSRRFRFSDALQDSQKLVITANTTALTQIQDERGEDVAIFRLDPLLIGSIFPIHGEDRVVVTPEEVPMLLQQALKVVEDRKFDTHHGVNLAAIVRAAWVNLRAGHVEQGGSTLTQQLVKSYFLDNRRTLGRKLEEAMMALLLEVHFEKQDLMNAYINEIYLGQDGRRAVHGFGLASEFYFGKPLPELQLHEIALLVAMVRGPSYYDPRRNAKRARLRRDLVLKLMATYKIIDDEAARQASAKPLGIVGAGTQAGGYYPAFLDLVRRTLRRDYREEDLTESGLRIFSTLNPLLQSQAETALSQELDRLDKLRKNKTHKLEGVVVVTAPQNGEVIAMVGGRHANVDGFNRALDAKRSIGSLVKPVIYLAAIESGRYHAASIIEDGPVEVKLANGKLWKPQNISHEMFGAVPLVRALSQSLNLATVRLGLEVGLPQVTKEFKLLGLEKAPPQLPSVLLGSLDVSPLEVAQLYNAFANGGFNTPLRAVRAVVDAKGETLKAFALEVTPVADPQAVYQVNRMLVEVMNRGTGRSVHAYLPAEMVVAGKSGTSSDYRDSWFAGFTGSHLGVVWIGFDDNTSTGLTGSSGSLQVWSKLMASIATTPWSAPLPETLEERWIEFPTGLAAKSDCGNQPLSVAVPRGLELPISPACQTGVLGAVGDRARQWWRGIIH